MEYLARVQGYKNKLPGQVLLYQLPDFQENPGTRC